MWCCRVGNGGRERTHGTNPVSVVSYTILRMSCTRCARLNGHCSRFGFFGQSRAILDIGRAGCVGVYACDEGGDARLFSRG